MPRKRTIPVVIAVSGGGRSLENFLEHIRESKMRFKIVGVISSSPDCRAVEVAKAAALPVFIGDFVSKDPRAREDLKTRLYEWIAKKKAEWICLAGFIKPFPLRADWAGKIINIHPALLPQFGGKGMYGQHVHAAVVDSGERVSGATVHFVNDKYDDGQIISQTRVPVLEEDSPVSLGRRVFIAECNLYPATLNDLIDGNLPLAGKVVKIYEF